MSVTNNVSLFTCDGCSKKDTIPANTYSDSIIIGSQGQPVGHLPDGWIEIRTKRTTKHYHSENCAIIYFNDWDKNEEMPEGEL